MDIQVSVETFLSSHNDPCIILNAGRTITAVNQAFEDRFELTAEQVIGQDYDTLFHRGEASCHDNDSGEHHSHILNNGLSRSFVSRMSSELIPSIIARSHAFPIQGDKQQYFIGEVIMPLEGGIKGVANSGMAGHSQALLHLVDELAHSAQNNLPVLLEGESGTGKELASEFIHNASPRHEHPFLTVDCTVLGADLFESELFGHEKGAFTGSTGVKKGLMELANKGTLFLDEIGEIPLSIQPKLLRALESGTYRRVGGTTVHKVDVRLVCATNRNLRAMVDAGEFREDLYYRIAVFTIQLPPLRDRLEDLPELCDGLLNRAKQGNTQRHLSETALRKLAQHNFPGNIRELANIMNLSQALSTADLIEAEFIQYQTQTLHTSSAFADMGTPIDPATEAHQGSEPTPIPTREDLEADKIRSLLVKYAGNRRNIADELGISERTLYRKLKRYELN